MWKAPGWNGCSRSKAHIRGCGARGACLCGSFFRIETGTRHSGAWYPVERRSPRIRGVGAHRVPGGTPAGRMPRRVPAAKPPERAPPGFVYKFCSNSGVPCPAAIFGNIEALFSGANKKRRAKALRCRILWITQYPYILSRCLLPAWASRCAGRSSSGSY